MRTATIVTIEGTHPGSVMLEPGQRVTVERTTMVANLIRQGFARVIEEHSEAVLSADDVRAEGTAAIDALGLNDPPQRPAKRASKTRWREYLDMRGVPWHQDMTRAELIALAEE